MFTCLIRSKTAATAAHVSNNKYQLLLFVLNVNKLTTIKSITTTSIQLADSFKQQNRNVKLKFDTGSVVVHFSFHLLKFY